MVFSLKSAEVRVFFAHFLRKNFVMEEGMVLAASAREQAKPLFGGSHASAGGTIGVACEGVL